MSSNKDLPEPDSKQYPMFGYQVKSSEIGIADIYDSTKEVDPRQRTQVSSGAAIKTGYDKQRSSHKKGSSTEQRKDQHHYIPMATNFAQGDAASEDPNQDVNSAQVNGSK